MREETLDDKILYHGVCHPRLSGGDAISSALAVINVFFITLPLLLPEMPRKKHLTHIMAVILVIT